MLKTGGYRQAGVYNMNRAADDDRHVAAYAVYEKTRDDGRSEVIIAIRGTGAGEWKLNMDLMPSGDYDLPYAENFALAAEDILNAQADLLSLLKDPVFLVTGHSRGAAVANILGARLTDEYGEDNVFAYTFATPRTVRGEYEVYDNIFNIINPADLVTYLPFPQWGFERYGTDITLPVDDPALEAAAEAAYAQRADQTGPFPASEGAVETVQQIIDAMASLSPDVASGYTVTHALAHPGEAQEGEPGLTSSEFMLALVDGNGSSLTGMNGSDSEQAAAVENDFTPLFAALSSSPDTARITMMHMPATYGAWMEAMTAGPQDDQAKEESDK